MSTVSASSSISCYSIFKPHKNPNTLLSFSLPIPLQSSHPCISISIPNSYPNSPVVLQTRFSNFNKIRSSVAEEETVVVPQQQEEQSSGNQGDVVEATVTVPVSRSDVLTMFFQAEGTMSEGAIPSVTSALEETEGISNLRVQVLEGIASVELKKKTTVQATGVASNLVEIIQNSGFKLQALNLSFDEDAN
ncbi:putative heavy metal-associated domain, HMA [Helianthus annuus]|nr:putative heavy metal-associated domain, HMA [Helianthus annuus]